MTVPEARSRGMRILVTGAAGFIGSHLCERLTANGHYVWGLDNFDDYYSTAIKRRNIATVIQHPHMRFIEGDIRDQVLLKGLFDSVPFDLVIHLAARPGIQPSLREPGLCYDVNVTGTLRLLEAMRHHRVTRLVFASSSSVYGQDVEHPFSEEHSACHPLSPYAASKRSGELLCHTWHHLWGLSVHCLRFFTVYGPRQRPDLAINKFLRLLSEGQPLPVYGDGSAGRDYTHIDDIVEGVCRSSRLLADLPTGEPTYQILNIGHGRAIKLRDLVETLASALGVKAKISRQPDQPGDVPITLADTRKLEKTLGFRPQVEFADGIQSYVEWLETIRSTEQVPTAH
jgi:UDP-glucuronate 4-epimerase